LYVAVNVNIDLKLYFMGVHQQLF